MERKLCLANLIASTKASSVGVGRAAGTVGLGSSRTFDSVSVASPRTKRGIGKWAVPWAAGGLSCQAHSGTSTNTHQEGAKKTEPDPTSWPCCVRARSFGDLLGSSRLPHEVQAASSRP